MEKRKLSTKKRMAVSEITGLLRDFADGLDNGKLTLEQDGEILDLSIPVDVEAKISGQCKEGKEKFSLELSWKQVDESAPIRINPEDKSNDNAKKEAGEKEAGGEKGAGEKGAGEKGTVKKGAVKKSLPTTFST